MIAPLQNRQNEYVCQVCLKLVQRKAIIFWVWKMMAFFIIINLFTFNDRRPVNASIKENTPSKTGKKLPLIMENHPL